jgi:hypothetical protein
MARLGPERLMSEVKTYLDAGLVAAIATVASDSPSLTVPTPVIYTYAVPETPRVAWVMEPISWAPGLQMGTDSFDQSWEYRFLVDIAVRVGQGAGATNGNDEALAHRYLQVLMVLTEDTTAPTLNNLAGVNGFRMADVGSQWFRFRDNYIGWRTEFVLDATPDSFASE